MYNFLFNTIGSIIPDLLKPTLSWFQKLKPCRVSDEPTTRHQDGEKLARPAGRHALSYRSGGCDSPSKCSRIAAITAPSVVHGTLSANEEGQPLMVTLSW